MFRSRFLNALILSTAALVGCGLSGPPLAGVEGEVRLDGRPLAGATVEFQPAKGSPSYGTTDANGKYELLFTAERKGAELGPHTVRITLDQDQPAEGSRAPRLRIPPRYNDESELTAEVAAGANRHDFSLESRLPATARRR